MTPTCLARLQPRKKICVNIIRPITEGQRWLLSFVAMENTIVWLANDITSPLLSSADVWSRTGLSLFLPEPSLPTRNFAGCKYSTTFTSGQNNTDEKKLCVEKEAVTYSYFQRVCSIYFVCLLETLSCSQALGWRESKHSTRHNSSSRFSLLPTGIPLASIVSSLHVASRDDGEGTEWGLGWGFLGVNSDELVVETERFLARWPSCRPNLQHRWPWLT